MRAEQIDFIRLLLSGYRLPWHITKQRYAGGHLIENALCRLKDFRRVATRYDKLATNFLSGVALATAITFWL